MSSVKVEASDHSSSRLMALIRVSRAVIMTSIFFILFGGAEYVVLH